MITTYNEKFELVIFFDKENLVPECQKILT
jgi:hypothetical protein